VQYFERTLDDSANRRLVIPEAFLATDAILLLMENVAAGLEVHRARIHHRIMDELPFMATEQLIVRAVEAGGDRQAVHEIIRRHSVEAAAAMKNNGKTNDLLDRLERDTEFPRGIDLSAVADPKRYIGRAPEQVDEFLAEVAAPLLANAPVSTAAAEAIRV
jgi:adenylosuccinate lyase